MSSTATFSALVLLSSGARQFFVVEGCPVHHGMFRITSCQRHSSPPHYNGQKCLPISLGGGGDRTAPGGESLLWMLTSWKEICSLKEWLTNKYKVLGVCLILPHPATRLAQVPHSPPPQDNIGHFFSPCGTAAPHSANYTVLYLDYKPLFLKLRLIVQPCARVTL